MVQELPTSEEYDRMMEYYGPYRDVECPECDSYTNLTSVPMLLGAERVEVDAKCSSCGYETTVEFK